MPPNMSSRLVRRWALILAVASGLTYLYIQYGNSQRLPPWLLFEGSAEPKISWANIPPTYPVDHIRPLPAIGAPIPKIQFEFPDEQEEDKLERLLRRDTVRRAAERSWKAYKEHAWLKDEVKPLSGESRNTFGGWGATLIDSLDTLLIMGMDQEFTAAVEALKHIDFTRPQVDHLNVFETTIRYLGGLLAAYDVSNGNHPILLEKAIELGDLLYAAFDTPNRMPVTRWDWTSYAVNVPQEAGKDTISSEIGSLTLEFTRLSQLTHDDKYFDAVERISDEFERSQGRTKMPGMWPITVNARKKYFTDDRHFSMGGMADSLYEYLVKQHVLLGAGVKRYESMYTVAIATAKKHLFFKPMTQDSRDILISGSARFTGDEIRLEPQGQHLACFVGGMLAIGSKVFGRQDDLETARRITDGCVWAYDSMPSGIMPEIFSMVPCNATGDCSWIETLWYDSVANRYKSASAENGPEFVKNMGLPPGWTEVNDGRYILRPEAIESVFIMYRVTGKKEWQDKAWRMFQAIEKATKTDIGYAALSNVNNGEPPQADSCESFWTAETLKYFYLIFSDPDLISLDDYVFNTEAHPLKRPSPV